MAFSKQNGKIKLRPFAEIKYMRTNMYHWLNTFFVFNSEMDWHFFDNTPDSSEEFFCKSPRGHLFTFCVFLCFQETKKVKGFVLIFCATVVSAAVSFTCYIKTVSTINSFPCTLPSASWEWVTFQTQGATYKIDVWEHVPPRKVFYDTALWHLLPSSLIHIKSLLHLFWTVWRFLFSWLGNEENNWKYNSYL